MFSYKNWTTIQKICIIVLVLSLLLGLVIEEATNVVLMVVLICTVGFFIFRKKYPLLPNPSWIKNK
jgi:uncharacterized membrane protein